MIPQEVLRRPIITEQASALTERQNQVLFEVHTKANKQQIREAVEKIYGVKVLKVRTAILPGKVKRRGGSVGKLSSWKKAFVSLKEGDVIDFFATE